MSHPLPKTVLFLCSGNFYRSRLAELLFNYYAERDGHPWRAKSRGLVQTTQLSGLSLSAVNYLDFRQLTFPDEILQRDPLPVTLEDLEEAGLTVLMNRTEHQPMAEQRFGIVARLLEEKGKLRYWNVYDVPPRLNLMFRVLWLFGDLGFQREESSTEHIDFAVRALERELAEKETAGQVDLPLVSEPRPRND